MWPETLTQTDEEREEEALYWKNMAAISSWEAWFEARAAEDAEDDEGEEGEAVEP